MPLLFAALAVIVVGCAGTGNNPPPGGGGGGGGVGNGGRSTAFVNLKGNIPGLIDEVFLPGQGRAVGDMTAWIGPTDIKDTSGKSIEDENALMPVLHLLVNGYNILDRNLDASVTSGPNRQFKDFNITLDRVDIAGVGTFTGNSIPSTGQMTFLGQLNVTVMQNRTTALQIYLNPNILFYDPLQSPPIVFDRAQFLSANTDGITGKINGFFSDLTRFDITHVAKKPIMESQSYVGTPASRVYVGGSFFGLSVNGNVGGFELITPFNALGGVFRPQDPVTGLATYDVNQTDPRYIGGPPRLILALRGTFQDYTTTLGSLGTFEVIAYPQVGDGSKQQLIAIQRDPNQGFITNMWFGTLDYAASPKPSFTLYSIDQLQPASTNNPFKGTMDPAGLLDANGLPVNTKAANWWQNVHQGSFSFANLPASVPTSFQTGRFIVYRA